METIYHLLSIGDLPQFTINKVIDIFNQSMNPNESLINSVNEYNSMDTSTNNVYFCIPGQETTSIDITVYPRV